MIEQRISAMVQLWRDAGQPKQAEYLEKQMAALFAPFLAPSRGH